MNKILHTLGAVISAAAALPSTAFAQDGSEEAAARTPEAAQAFLSTYLQQGGWDVLAFSFFDGTTFRYYGGSAWHEVQERPKDGFTPADEQVEGQIQDFKAVERCVTIVAVQPRWLHEYHQYRPQQPLSSPDLSVRIDWTAVQPIKVIEETAIDTSNNVGSTGKFKIWVQSPKINTAIAFRTSDRTVADRAAFAMSFLQQHCDPTAGSAF